MTKIIKLEDFPNLKINKKKKVLATGCFDVLHPGHKEFLKAAKKQGEILIVGLETDKRIKQLKGKGRPVNNEERRLRNLAELKIPDFIFLLPSDFNKEKTHLSLLQLIKPEILAVSSNSPYLKKKNKLIEKIGGTLFVFPLNPYYSTTKCLTNC